MPSRSDRLSPQQQRAVDAYLEHGNMRQALLDAGYSTETASKQQSRFFRRKAVAAAVQNQLDEEMTAREVLHRLGRLAREGSEQARIEALKTLAKKQGLLKDKVEHEHSGEIRIVDPYAEPEKKK